MLKAVQCTKETMNIFYHFMLTKAETSMTDVENIFGDYLLTEIIDGVTIVNSWLVKKEMFLKTYKFIEGANLDNFSEVRFTTPSDWEQECYGGKK